MRPIGDYAIIGDCRSAALVSRDGSIDWLCLPRFDSPSVFAAILDPGRGGHFRVSVRGEAAIARRYIGDSAVLETTCRTDTGVARVIDAMPVADEAEKRQSLWPDHEVLRLVECLEGDVTVDVVYEPRMDYARARAPLHRGPWDTIACAHGAASLTLRSDVPLAIDPSGTRASGSSMLAAGDRATIGLSFAHGMPTVLPAEGARARQLVEDSVRWWERWAAQCIYTSRHRDAVVRSALTLKLLTYAPSGAMVAAATTSLPEKIGGVRNWDYRYCWLRDASLTLCALVDLGCRGEGEAFLSWALHATRLTQPHLQVLYDVYGESRLPEVTLDHLSGYAGSRPVRVGNAAVDQLQLDVYGEVIDAVYQFVERGGRIDRTTGLLVGRLARAVCRLWEEPDEGIWEPRVGRHHHTYSKVMCWVALDRLIALHDRGHVRLPIDGMSKIRDAIRERIETRGWNPAISSYTAVFDTDVLDASLLRLATSGYADPRSDRMRLTIDRIQAQLGATGLVYRYLTDDGLPPGEGAFTICGFWLVEALALSGRVGDATALFDRLVGFGNDVGLFSEQMDPATGRPLGNFPQAFSHVGLINAALTLARCTGETGAARGRGRKAS